jgi:hypothetical protein
MTQVEGSATTLIATVSAEFPNVLEYEPGVSCNEVNELSAQVRLPVIVVPATYEDASRNRLLLMNTDV